MLIMSLLLACGGGDPDGTDPDGITLNTVTSPPLPADPPDTTWYADIEPVVRDHCSRCHDGTGVAPADFTDPDTVVAWSEIMLSRIDVGLMPPPSADPTCHPYVGHEKMVLPPDSRDLFAHWVELGSPLGDPADAVPDDGTSDVATLSRRDVELRPPVGRVPTFGDGNEYRCFLVDTGVADDTFITGIEFLIDNPAISHHALLFIDPDGGSEALVTDPETMSWTCSGVQPSIEYQLMHAWAPGGGALEFPDDQGIRLTAGSQIVVQMHYFEGMSDPPPDRPGYALKLDETVDEEIFYTALGPTDFRIPAGDPSYQATWEIDMFWLTLGLVEYEVLGVLPHMHLLGTAYEFQAIEPDGDVKCISRADAYDFDLQPTYWFEYPVTVEPDDVLSISCTWDNSAGTADVTWGENTQDEMCFALMYVRSRLAF